MTTIVERTAGHYEAHEEHYGKNYVWCPGCVVVECECGERMNLNTTESTCRCGADHAPLIEEELASRRSSEEAPRSLDPLDRDRRKWREKQEVYLRSEEHYQLEMSAID
jgi:hypothetical protein